MLPSIHVGTVSQDWQSDGHGHANGPANIMETIVQVGNELGSGNADPKVWLTAQFTQMHGDHLDRGSHDSLYDRFLFSTLGVFIIGHYVGFTKSSLLRAFRAACFLRADIHNDTLRVMEHPSAPLSVRNLPYIRKIPAWSQTTIGCEEELEFHLLGDVYHADTHRFENRWMCGGIWQGKPVAVKFTRGISLSFAISVQSRATRRSFRLPDDTESMDRSGDGVGRA
ncbi:hypothetical protein EDB87DRAFT_702019 [Lactarius vividus]|nr:hypothetical protein EDB87DRAFT_702019 [Lactarius vividus]